MHALDLWYQQRSISTTGAIIVHNNLLLIYHPLCSLAHVTNLHSFFATLLIFSKSVLYCLLAKTLNVDQ